MRLTLSLIVMSLVLIGSIPAAAPSLETPTAPPVAALRSGVSPQQRAQQSRELAFASKEITRSESALAELVERAEVEPRGEIRSRLKPVVLDLQDRIDDAEDARTKATHRWTRFSREYLRESVIEMQESMDRAIGVAIASDIEFPTESEGPPSRLNP